MKKNANLKLLLDLKDQPISNRYLECLNESEELFPLKLGQCQDTGLIQLIDPVPSRELVPKFEWINYYEPEEHLDSLVDTLSNELLKKKGMVVGGISPKDHTHSGDLKIGDIQLGH